MGMGDESEWAGPEGENNGLGSQFGWGSPFFFDTSTPGQTMPTRGLRPSLARTHSRSSSGASSKMVVNLQLTQKDLVQPKIDKARRTSHPHEVRHHSLAITPIASSERCSRISFTSIPMFHSLSRIFFRKIIDRGIVQPNARANVSRTGSTVHVQPREQVTGAQPRRATNPPPARGGRPKAGFTIATSTVASDDEDEWVSSESGGATPLDDASGDEASGKKTPQEVSPATPVDHVGQRAKGQNPAHVPGTTPRAEPAPPRPRVQTNGFAPTRPTHGAAAQAMRISSSPEPSQYPQLGWDPYRQQRPKKPRLQPADTTQVAPQQSLPHLSRQPPTPSHIPDQTLPPKPPRTPDAVPGVGGVRTEPPTPTSPRSGHYQTHRVRPSSTRSLIAEHALRPHPLIRGQSFGHGHLAPLKVSSDAAQAQLSSSPPSVCAVSTSPTSIRTIHTPSQTASPGRHFSNAIFRRPSTSSAHSVATLPVTPHTPAERVRTMSTLSTASSSAALSSLAHLPTRGSVAASQNASLVVHFPPQDPHSHPETVHAFLPPPYVTPHFTVLQWRSPICESHDKVVRARESQRRRHRT